MLFSRRRLPSQKDRHYVAASITMNTYSLLGDITSDTTSVLDQKPVFRILRIPNFAGQISI
jgi:hypothetical protein